MDPDANLREQREIFAELARRDRHGLASLDADIHSDGLDLLVRLAELAQALDEWISRGGYLPAAWQAAQASSAQLAQAVTKRAELIADAAEAVDTIDPDELERYAAEHNKR